MSMSDNIDTENTLSLNIATGGQIAIIKNKNPIFQVRPSINDGEYYDCITQLPAGRLIDLYLKSTNNSSLNLINIRFNESIYKKLLCVQIYFKK